MNIDYKIAHAAGQDAGDRNMRNAGRTAWNEDDWNEAARVMNKLLESLHPVLMEQSGVSRTVVRGTTNNSLFTWGKELHEPVSV